MVCDTFHTGNSKYREYIRCCSFGSVSGDIYNVQTIYSSCKKNVGKSGWKNYCISRYGVEYSMCISGADNQYFHGQDNE